MDATIAVATPAPSPWWTMWFSPRRTVRRILDSEVRPNWVTVIVLATVGLAIASLKADETGALSASRSMMPVLIGSLQTIFGVLIGPFLLAIVGEWLGGEADASDLRHAVAWSYVPIAASSVLWIPILLTIGTRAFGADVGDVEGLEWLGVVLMLVVGVASIWSLPLMVGAVAAAQRFSIGKALLSWLILSTPFLLLTLMR
jgi:hypothetical protein